MNYPSFKAVNIFIEYLIINNYLNEIKLIKLSKVYK